MCASDYPDPKRDLKPRKLEASDYLSNGNTYLIPELNLPERRKGTRPSVYNQGVAIFVFSTPDGKEIRVPAGSTVKCISLAEVEE